ncbi:molecular chaperone [Halobacteriaceae archaeon GCM10025711]
MASTHRDPVCLDEAADTWADLYSLLAECLKEPTTEFVEEAGSGLLASELDLYAERLDLQLADTEPPEPEACSRLTREYLALFEGMETPFAPPVESPYEEWYEGAGRTGLLGGPAAADMEQRYERLGVVPSMQYPADHLALLLEYGALLLDAGATDEFDAFATEHFDWVPAFRERVDDAAADAPFYRWVVAVVDDVVSATP